MTTKLNLTIEEGLAKKIKSYAKEKNVSVSKIVEEYFDRLVSKENPKERISDKAAGIIKDIVIDDVSAARDKYLREKHGF